MGKYKSVYIRRAEQIGTSKGGYAATWYWDSTSNLTDADYQRVWQGIQDCDPEIMDSLPSTGLSGEYAGDYVQSDLLREVGMYGKLLTDEKYEWLREEVTNAYSDAFHQAAQDTVQESCRAMLRKQITLYIQCDFDALRPEDISKWAAKVSDVAAQHPQVSIDDTFVTEGIYGPDDERIW